MFHFAAIERMLFLPIRARRRLRNSSSVISAMKLVYHRMKADASIFLLTCSFSRVTVSKGKGNQDMNEQIYIVVYRYSPTDRWQAKPDGVFEGEDAKRLADNYAEILRVQAGDRKWEYVVVRGPIANSVDMAKAEAELGVF
jgi:hypothetical protein